MNDTTKASLLKHCTSFLIEKAQYLRDTIREMQQSANEETKSSVGDKYETGRAMAQLEIEKLSAQLKEIEKQQDSLSTIIITPQTTPKIGSVVMTTQGNF